MKLKTIFELAREYLSAASPEADKQKFESLLEGLASRGQDPDEEMLADSKDKILKRLRQARNRKSRSRQIFLMVRKYAAGLLLLGLLAWSYYHIQDTMSSEPQRIVKVTEVGVRSTVTLSDGSMVRLNENSTLEFPEVFEGDERVVYLSGEAFFDIQPDADRPFKVFSGKSEIVVLGTSFNVNSFKKTEITVASGKVKVSDIQTRENVELVRGQQAVLDSGVIQVLAVNPDFYIGWHTRRLVFEEESVEQVFRILERVYGVTIELNKNSPQIDCLVTGFYEGERIETILKGLTHIIDFKYETDIATKTITINLIKCKS
ncbi:FecR family protein [Negadavirga shengliensis]|uniref:FecR family protein n=1 Tax=Negadavirga shengliensis TaxID=1389218 RepID=A0ABV9SX38_9BACT